MKDQSLITLFIRDLRLLGVRLALELLRERRYFRSLTAEEKARFLEGH